jgi:restriction system protein
MDYDGSRADAAEAIGKSGDEGLDGVIKEDRLSGYYLCPSQAMGSDGRPSGDSEIHGGIARSARN